MKLQVITDQHGKVLGTFHNGTAQPGAPVFGGFTATSEQKVHELDINEELLNTKDAGEFHKAVEKMINHK
jgi:hypothetical protein